MAERHSILIGIDGGGTRCRLAVELAGQRHQLETGPTNVTSDFDGAIATLKAGLAELAQSAVLPLETLLDAPAHFGLAGIVSPKDAERVSAALAMPHARYSDDQTTSIRGALGRDDGIVISLGTGSFIVRQLGGEFRKIGGWGLILGDEASGAWLGREAVADALRVQDGLLQETPFLRMLGPRLTDLVSHPKQTDFAALAPKVFAAANENDPSAKAILDRGLAYLAASVTALDPEASLPLCLIGGLANAYLPLLPAPLANRLVLAKGTALDGALDLAREASLT
ncbi:BadF/BadG/BcrA/BcrD ATPase family protein [Rhodophyticola sp. SM2404]